MPAMPLVSVVMGTYNGQQFLKEQMDTLLQQTYPELEFVICDDLSTDATYQVLQEYAAADSRIRLFKNEKNLGYNLNFERALKLATGEYIAIADQDDRWEVEKIKYLMEQGWKDPEVALIHSPSALFKTGQPVDWGSVHSRVPFSGKDGRKFFIYNHISGHNMLFRKRLLEQAIPFPDHFYYDWWLAAVASCNGGIAYVDKVLAYHRIHEKNASGFSGHLRPFYLHVLETLPVLLTIPNLPAEAKGFGEALLEKYRQLEKKEYSFALNMFILKHARTIFSFKKNRFPFFSYLKHSKRISSAGFLKKEH